MYIVKCKGTWIDSGQNNLYFSLTFCCVAPGHWDSRKIKFCAMFSKSSLFKIEYSINIETQCLKNIRLYFKPYFHFFTRKKGPLAMLPETPPGEKPRGEYSVSACFAIWSRFWRTLSCSQDPVRRTEYASKQDTAYTSKLDNNRICVGPGAGVLGAERGAGGR